MTVISSCEELPYAELTSWLSVVQGAVTLCCDGGPKVQGAPPMGPQSHCWGGVWCETHTNNHVFIRPSDLLISHYSSLPLCVFFSFVRWMSEETTGKQEQTCGKGSEPSRSQPYGMWGC